jgi:outer membrane receptor for ferrienterochelin and colicins
MFVKFLLFITLCISTTCNGQAKLSGNVTLSKGKLGPCLVGLKERNEVQKLDTLLRFEFLNLSFGIYTINCFCEGYEPFKKEISIHQALEYLEIIPDLKQVELSEIYANANSKEHYKLNSPIVTEVFEKAYFDKNPVNNLTEMMDRVNGVKCQVNCNVCGTSDIHINGMEGPYSLIVLDGIPMVGGLSTVYGLAGIPSFLIDKIEVTKGPASSMYGSEAVAGVIHVFTKRASNKGLVSFQNNSSSHGEISSDLGLIVPLGKNWQSFTGINHFWMNQRIDQNKDNFTDIALQHRISAFQRFSLLRPNNKIFDISARFLHENRWGGETDWNKTFLASDSIYGEAIYTNRAEVNLAYQLPFKEKIHLVSHAHLHDQESYYGNVPFIAKQVLTFSQLTWEKKVKKHALLVGSSFRSTHYNDNTGLTLEGENKTNDKPLIWSTLGMFIEDTWNFHEAHKILTSFRLDYQTEHGFIPTPRIAYWYKISRFHSIRLHAGNGFRAVNLFSEDHAALTGARNVEITEKLKPEKSWSFNLSHTGLFFLNEKWTLETTTGLFYSYFSNRIVADYETDPQKIIYANRSEFSEIYGINLDLLFKRGKQFSAQVGITHKNVNLTENGLTQQQILTEKWSGNWTISFSLPTNTFRLDYTGNFSGSMRVPTLSSSDPRPSHTQPYSIHNLQLTYNHSEKFQLFMGVKNLLNWTPAKGLPFLIARSHDPFDKEIEFDSAGNVLATSSNPYALSFDPSYVYAMNQGTRFFVGFRWSLELKN